MGQTELNQTVPDQAKRDHAGREKVQREIRVAMFVGVFPVLSETFIVNQIVQLLKAGVKVDIFSMGEPKKEPLHPIVSENNLLEHCCYVLQAKRSKLSNVLEIVRSLLTQPRWYTTTGLSLLMQVARRVPGWNIAGVFRVAERTLRNGPYDIVHSQFGDLGVQVLPLVQRGILSGKIATSIRGHDVTQVHRFDRKFYAELMAHGDLFMPVSHSMTEQLVRLGCAEKRIRLVRSGIDCTKFEYAPRTLQANQPLQIISVARLVEMKGIEYAIRAAGHLAEKNVSFNYNIIGDGPLRPALQSLIEELGLAGQVTLCGPMPHDQVLERLGQAHVMVMPSVTAANGEMEGLPNAIKEAMAQGLVVVATRHSGIPELVEDEVTGYLVDEKDDTGLARQLEKAGLNGNEWPAITSRARAKVEAEYNLPVVHRTLLDSYLSLLPEQAHLGSNTDNH